MTEPKSKCCEAEVKHQTDDEVAYISWEECTACGKPCKVIEEKPLTPITEMTNAVSTPLSTTPPASQLPDSGRLLNDEIRIDARYVCDEIGRANLPPQDRASYLAITPSGHMVIYGQPGTEGHNCDAMGCSSIEHVLHFERINTTAQRDLTASLKDGEIQELLEALDGILGYAEEYHFAFDGETGKTRDWYLQAVSHAQEVSKKYRSLKLDY